MALIKTIDTGLYRIPLTVSLSDSTHGKIKAFELVTCRVRDSDGAEGVGYTYTVGRNGGAIADISKVWASPLRKGSDEKPLINGARSTLLNMHPQSPFH